ncbi:hypothetical protein LTR36_009930 [Oleoguttula mirabilis]|uniref:DUF1308 domain-containing protein n=1 Tax=Oleoguttula mirabilis TaxID=1507867 RepID=A0AAV9J4U7_9PEZI|nr:hypothetical protein LTR36_009930 [Oleoguttula mirabilis]
MDVKQATMSPVQSKADEPTVAPTVDGLIVRAKALLRELEVFRERLQRLRHEDNVEVGHFRGNIRSELNMLERLRSKPNDEQTTHVARSSNLPFLEHLWSTVKKSRDVIALQKRVYTSSGVQILSQGMRHVNLDGISARVNGSQARDGGTKDGGVVVDAITDGGLTWIKSSLVTNQRLIYDLAKQGWDSGGSEDEDEDGVFPSNDDDDRDVPLLRTVKELTRAAKCFRVRTKSPQVHIVLPRIRTGETPEVDAILEKCRATGAILHSGEDVELAPELQDALRTMALDPMESFSDVLNIDCTILLAIVSEFSHAKVSKQPWFDVALRRQVEIEDNENLLPSLLYPAMSSHKLVCTQEAAKRMREIVETIGTPSEKARTAIIMGEESNKSQAELVRELQEWSAYEVPSDWQLPITVVDRNENACQSHLPPQALEAAASMTEINRSVFLYGWAAGRTTITSNRTVVKQVENALERSAEEIEDDVWPRIWLCPTARSLVGKEKRGAKKQADRGKEAAKGAANGGVWPLPDPLRRESQRRNGLDVLSQREGYEVEDLRPNGYPCEDVLAAKNASLR